MSRHLEQVVTDDQADHELLVIANEKGKMAIEVVAVLPDHLQLALERAMDNDWIQLIDVGQVSAAPGKVMRVFRLTKTGWERRGQLLKEMGH